MFISRKIRLKPTAEQEELFKQSAGVARWAYNFYLSEQERVYQEYLNNGKTGTKTISENVVRKYINNVLKPTTHQWLKNVGSNVMKQGVKDADIAYKRFAKGISGKPKFKSKRNTKMSFYVNYEHLIRVDGGFRGEKIGVVKTSEPLPKIPKNQHYLTPHISYDGKYWYLSIVYEKPIQPYETTGESIGIDLGVKDLAICSNGKVYGNINKTNRVKKIEKKLKRAQRKLSRRKEQNVEFYDINHRPIYKRNLEDCRNYQKQKRAVKLLYRRLANIRQNYLHQTTTEIVKTKPSRIVMETLNVKGMLQNHNLAKAIAEQKFYEFKRQIQYKCAMHGIEFVEVPQFYPSSKTCSHCGAIKKDLKLSDRTYHCDSCGFTVDRDMNAAMNLASYFVESV